MSPPARKGAPPRRPPPPRSPRPRNAPAGETLRRVGARARTYARRYAPQRTPVLTTENLADAAASIVGGVGTAVLGGLAADKFDPRWSNSVIAGTAGTASLFTAKGGWRTFLQSVASASAGQAALAILADDDKPVAPPKTADNTSVPKPASNPAPIGKGAGPGKRNAMPSSSLDRAFARSEARIAQMLADDGYDT